MKLLWYFVFLAVLVAVSFGEEFGETAVPSETGQDYEGHTTGFVTDQVFGGEQTDNFVSSSDTTTGATAEQSLKCPGVCQADPCIAILNETDCLEGMTCCLDHLETIATSEFAESEFTTDSLLDSNTVQEIDSVEEHGETDSENVEVFDMFSTHQENGPTTDVYTDSEKDEDFQSTTSAYSNPETDFQSETSDYSIPEMDFQSTTSAHSFPETEVTDKGDYEEVTGSDDYEFLYPGTTQTTSNPYFPGVSKVNPPLLKETKCPGKCVPSKRLFDCDILFTDTRVCPLGSVCCLRENEYLNEDKPRVPAKRSVDQIAYDCPGSCMHPSHMMYCERVLPQFSCPLNSKCCTLPIQRAQPQEQTECTGTCLPFHMSGYCLPPREIVMGPTNCEQGSSCCMMNPKNSQPPRFKAMAFPSPHSSPSNSDFAANLLGHLAVDKAGKVYKVSQNGLISLLKDLPRGGNTQNLIKLATYQRMHGEIVIYSTPTGELYQQFIPRQSNQNSRGKQTPFRQPIRQFDSQASEMSTSFNVGASEKEKPVQTDINRDTVMDIVIPDDDDEAPVTKNSPVIHTDKTSRPPCPGSCMSYFLRFTCFRGYAIYDGFTCPGRGVCCARLKEIEEHEEYLKSQSPYFNAPPATRDSTLPRCGLKGRRDTPRIMGGKDSLSGEWCWQVAIINVQNQYLCGGALIDNSWVLTAAHCVVTSLEEGQALFIRAGSTDLKSQADNSKAQTIRVLSVFIHHNFNTRNLDNNIALLRIQKPAVLGPNVCVVCLPTSKMMPTEGTKCTVTGYGFVAPEGGMSLRIREAKVPIIDDVECMANVTEALDNPFIIPASSFCAGGAGVEDACQGDAGGALTCEVSGFYELIGLVSWGLGCGKVNVPSIYVKIPAFMGWINQIISSSSFVLPSTQI